MLCVGCAKYRCRGRSCLQQSSERGANGGRAFRKRTTVPPRMLALRRNRIIALLVFLKTRFIGFSKSAGNWKGGQKSSFHNVSVRTGPPNFRKLLHRDHALQIAGSRSGNKVDIATRIHIGIATGSVNKMTGNRNNARIWKRSQRVRLPGSTIRIKIKLP